MIRHIVLVRFKPETSDADIGRIFDQLRDLVHARPGASNFGGGRSESPEGIERGYHHGFTIDFDSWPSLADYSADPDHQKIAEQIVANAVDGIEGVLVLDIEMPTAD